MSRIQASLQIVRLIVFVPLSVQFITKLIQLHRVSWPERRVGCMQMSADGV